MSGTTSRDGRRRGMPGCPLHVLVFSNTYLDGRTSTPGGADRDLLNLLNALGPDRVSVSWVGVRGCEKLRPHLDPHLTRRFLDLNLPPFDYISTSPPQGRSRWLWTKILADYALRLVKPLRSAQRALGGERVDLVLTGNSTVLLGAAYARCFRRTHIWMVKECLDPTAPACRRYARWISRLSSAVVVPSQAVARPFPPGVLVLPDGNDVGRIRDASARPGRTAVLASLGLSAGEKVVAQVGLFTELKGQHVTAEAFVRLAAERGRAPCSLLFLGAGRASYLERIKAVLAASPHSLLNAVRFVQFQPDDYSYLAAADVVVHPSVLPDSYPNAVREAMVLGVPVIGSPDPGGSRR